MFKTTCMGRKNLIGIKLRQLRAEKFPELSQRAFAEKLQLIGMDVGKNRISDIELGKSFVTDIEVCMIAEVLGVGITELMTISDNHEDLYKTSKNDYVLDIADSSDVKYK